MTRSVGSRRGVVLLLLLALAGPAGGCARLLGEESEGAEPGGALAVVVGGRANVPPPSLHGAAAAARDQAVDQQSFFSVVVADGAPYQVSGSGPLRVDGETEDERAEQRTVNRAHVDTLVAEAAARAPESDLVTAIDLAVQTLHGEPGLQTLVVVDSGLSTAGPVDFTRPGMLDADPVEVADSLADTGRLPDLRGFTVVFQGLGETAAPQQELSAAHRARLEAMWTEVARRAGAAAVQVEGSQPVAATQVARPAVSLVPVPPPIACTPGRIVLTGGVLGFRPGEPLLLDRRAATEALRPLAEHMIADGDVITEVFGTYADVGEPDLRRSLSEQRAQEVADVLIDLGVPTPQLHVLGLGSDFPEFVPDRDASGHFDPAAAALNRTVILVPTEPLPCG